MKTEESIIVVSGLPRSGTSLMMQMCEAGGLMPLVDQERKADQDNLRGYYELQKVKRLKEDKAWLPEARGKIVKVISALLKHLPLEYPYRVIFMLRDIDEVIASQKQMLLRRGEPNRFSDEELQMLFRNHLRQVRSWLSEMPNFEVLYIDYNQLLKSPLEKIGELQAFLGNDIKAEGMASSIDHKLYRQRRAAESHPSG